jgi:hypothetical protein
MRHAFLFVVLTVLVWRGLLDRMLFVRAGVGYFFYCPWFLGTHPKRYGGCFDEEDQGMGYFFRRRYTLDRGRLDALSDLLGLEL